MSLPSDLDFVRYPEATPDRMNRAMTFILSRLRGVESLRPGYEAAIEELRRIGLERVAEALTPVFLAAQETGASLQAIYDRVNIEGALDARVAAAAAEAIAAAEAATIATEEVANALMHRNAAAGHAGTATTRAQEADAAAIAAQQLHDAVVLHAAAVATNMTTVQLIADAIGDVGDLGSMAAIDKASVAQTRARVADAGITAALIRDALEPVEVPFSTTLTLDCEAGINFRATPMTANIFQLSVTKPIPGATLTLALIGDGPGAKSVAYHSNFKGELPVINNISPTVRALLMIYIAAVDDWRISALVG